MKIYKTQTEVGIECDTITKEVIEALRGLGIDYVVADVIEDEKVSDSDSLKIVIAALDNCGFMSKRELKEIVKSVIGSAQVEKTIKQYKKEHFKYKKEGGEWLVGMRTEATADDLIKSWEQLF